MNREDICPQITEILDITIGIYDHQMNIQWFLRVMCNGLNDWHTKANVGYKNAVHDVQVKPICF